MGSARYCMPWRDDLACSERYADDIPLSFAYRQLPPTAAPTSKQSKGMPRACRTWQEAIPDEPAPMTHTRLMAGCCDDSPARAKLGRPGSQVGNDVGLHAVRRGPPVPAAKERDGGRHQQGANEEGVHQDADSKGGEDIPVYAAPWLAPHHEREHAERPGEDEPGRRDCRAGTL